jgi:hypothetical protein
VTRPRVLPVAAVAVAVVAVVGLVLDGPMAAYYPAVTALLAGLSIYLETRYPQPLKRWTRRRVIDTTAFLVLLVGLFAGGFLVTKPGTSLPWTLPVTGLVIVATMPFTFAGLVREAFPGPQAAQRAANERDHGTGHTALGRDDRPATGEGRPG